MTILTRKFMRFSALMVVLGLMLGLTVTGCSDKDRSGGHSPTPPTSLAEITYCFAQSMDIAAKANLEAEQAIMTAYASDGQSVTIEQATTISTEHKDVTPADMIGTTIWEGTASVATEVNKLVLTYLDANGNAVGAPEVMLNVNVNVNDTTSFDFTEDVEPPKPKVTWDPTDDIIEIVLDESVTIKATDSDGNNLRISLEPASEAVIIEASTLTGKVVTGETPVEVTAKAWSDGDILLDTKKYQITVFPHTYWVPEAPDSNLELLLGSPQVIDAEDEAGNILMVIAETSNPEIISIDAIDLNRFYCRAVTGDTPVTVTATAYKDDVKVGKKVYSVTILPNVLTWDPADTSFELTVGDYKKIIATYENDGVVIEYDIKLESSNPSLVSVSDNKCTGIKETGTEPVVVKATAFNGDIKLDEKEYSIIVKQ